MIEKIQTILKQELAMMGYELIDMEFSGKNLRLTIDKPGGVSLEDCVSVNRRVGLLLDAEDPINGSYRLEVSSPGLNRKIKSPNEYDYFSGRRVKLQTIEGVVKGTLKGLKDESVILDMDGSEFSVRLGDIIKANLDF